jgi:hypothetical protein
MGDVVRGLNRHYIAHSSQMRSPRGVVPFENSHDTARRKLDS